MAAPPSPCKILIIRDSREKQIFADPDTSLEAFRHSIEAAAGVASSDCLTLQLHGAQPETVVAIEQIHTRCLAYAYGKKACPYSGAAWNSETGTLSLAAIVTAATSAGHVTATTLMSHQHRQSSVNDTDDVKLTRTHTPEGTYTLEAVRDHALYDKLSTPAVGDIVRPRLLTMSKVEGDRALSGLYDKCETAAYAQMRKKQGCGMSWKWTSMLSIHGK